MKIHRKMTMAVLIMTTAIPLLANPALSHSFNVALVLPGTPASSPQARQIRQGFMLATTERDGHANEESDGHLGGLDSYVSQATTPGNMDADIVALLGSKESTALFRQQVNQDSIAILTPGKTPFANKTDSGVANFIASFKAAYGTDPTAAAAQGYNAARRIAAAVRAQGAADNKKQLTDNFKQTANSFTW